MNKLDEIMELYDKASKGPWKVEHKVISTNDGDFHVVMTKIVNDSRDVVLSSFINENDAKYIVSACNAVHELVQYIKNLQYKIKELEK